MSKTFLNSEYSPLKKVLLARPFFKTKDNYSPGKLLHLRNVDSVVMGKEYERMIILYKKFGIKSYLVNLEKIPRTGSRYLFNLMFTRDLFFMTPKGAIVSRMNSLVRRQEPRYAQRSLKDLGVPIRKVISAPGTFEGADALWVSPETVIIGLGKRTNKSGFKQVKEELSKDGVACLDFPASYVSPHLLGAIQIIDKDLALVRADAVKSGIIKFLRKSGLKIVTIPENDEIKNKQAFNFITVAPREVIMPADCPKTKLIFQRGGVKVLAEISVTQLINAGGGLACATGMLIRNPDKSL